MADASLMALYWTTAGPVEIHAGREWSRYSWHDRCEQAAKAGFEGIGLWHADVSHQLETGTTLEEMRTVYDDAGLRYMEVEFLADFWVPEGEPKRVDSDRLRKQLFETAAAFDAHHIKVGNIPETPCELDRLIEEYAALCDDAAQHTDAKVAYEIIPFDPNVHTLETGIALVTGAARANGGLAIDTWHMGKLRIPPEALGAIPGEYLAWVELSDGPVEYMDDPLDEVINHRRCPGEGEFDIPGYIEACRSVGYDGPWGVEILSAELRALPIEEAFERAYETTAAQFRATVT
ncbi:MAG TPA: sugar phosphate isomerase/epimerase [Solirubrobacteraceae bacterium]|nr:sugar phosphate isomerase/epimerase [Solirubrobacteraceae bacterium]